ncbi:MAG TPA: GTPase ObgE [Firmicutes bacterium]|nr:GTPase ObgE [Candidatus Fermentithermobacillaceae bacterium]
MSSRFIDRVKVYLKAGDGGRGCVAFRREKYVPFGGPAGGDGGDGGDIIFRVDPGLNTLLDFKYHPHLKAQNGRPGEGDKRAGKRGEDLIVRVPPGTVVRDLDTGEIIADLVAENQEAIIAKGGKGGRGNAHFATSVDRAPRKYEEGTPGQERRVELELKSIADVGLVGFPNAGKSTLLRAISNATPEVAPYPFTTLTPHLGTVEHGDFKFVVADIPGLIRGASEGKGLGHEFLRHIERTFILLYVVDIHGFEGDALGDFVAVRNEVLSYSESMKKKASLVAINKIDLAEPEKVNEVKEALEDISGTLVFPISAEKKIGLGELIQGLARILTDKKKDF